MVAALIVAADELHMAAGEPQTNVYIPRVFVWGTDTGPWKLLPGHDDLILISFHLPATPALLPATFRWNDLQAGRCRASLLWSVQEAMLEAAMPSDAIKRLIALFHAPPATPLPPTKRKVNNKQTKHIHSILTK